MLKPGKGLMALPAEGYGNNQMGKVLLRESLKFQSGPYVEVVPMPTSCLESQSCY